jgi:hypothetical protein
VLVLCRHHQQRQCVTPTELTCNSQVSLTCYYNIGQTCIYVHVAIQHRALITISYPT